MSWSPSCLLVQSKHTAVKESVLLPKSCVLADWNAANGLSVDDGSVAAARVVGAVGGDRADLLDGRILTQQVG